MKCFSIVNTILVSVLASYVNAVKIYNCTESKTIALTFDDGPWKFSNQLVDYLISQNDVKATFFTLGKFHYPFAVDTPEYQQVMKKAHDHGMQIASHTFGHKISEVVSEFRQSLTDQENLIELATGDRPRYLRAPKGNCTEECQAHLDEWGYRLIQWDVDSHDWDVEGSGSAEQRIIDSINILQSAFNEGRDNYLILMHDTEEHTVNSIAPWIVEQSGMREKGYRFVTVAECLGEKEYMYVSGKTYDSVDINTQNLKSDAFSIQTTFKLLPYLAMSLLASLYLFL